MKIFARLGAALALIAAAALIWIWLNPSPERVILRQMARLEESLAVHPGEGNFARVAAVNKAMSVFGPEIQVNTEGMPRVGDLSIATRTELQQALFNARTQLQGEVNFYDVRVVVEPAATNAVVNFTAVARLANQPEPFSQDIKAHFQKVEGKWLIHRVEPIALK